MSPEPAEVRPATYIVRTGDTAHSIAVLELEDVFAWRELLELNELRDPRRLTPGQVLKLPRAE